MKDFHCTPSAHSHSRYKKKQKAFLVFRKIPVTTTRGSSMYFQLAVREHIPQLSLSHLALLRFTKLFKSSGIDCKQVILRNIHKEGSDKQHNTTLKTKLK